MDKSTNLFSIHYLGKYVNSNGVSSSWYSWIKRSFSKELRGFAEIVLDVHSHPETLSFDDKDVAGVGLRQMLFYIFLYESYLKHYILKTVLRFKTFLFLFFFRFKNFISCLF